MNKLGSLFPDSLRLDARKILVTLPKQLTDEQKTNKQTEQNKTKQTGCLFSNSSE